MERLNNIYRKDDASYKLIFKDKSTGDAINITGWTVMFYLKNKSEDLDSAAILTKTVTSFDSPTSGIAIVELTSTDTDRVGNFAYKFVAIDSNSKRRTYIVGSIGIIQA